ncbi:ATP-binding cassette domain-containing protein [Echinicola salinicaeni]|uniref:ATP-binding cassette domain-containing protein n=1 Tax=Echinicola salinicaeni TaxID=2762757 RepID=UPI001644BAB4|nr:ATP-binding cassette domain-containing protein [Echinicola salinicaeni]
MLEIIDLEIKIEGFELRLEKNIIINSFEKVLITGQNGAGKSVFLYSILNMIKSRKGTILINGCPNDGSGWQKYVGAYLDQYFLIPHLRPIEHLKYVGMLKMVNGTLFNDVMKTAIDRLGFDVFQNRFIRELSEGNRKKLGLISSLIGTPQLLLWDEPFSSLDDKSKESLINLIKDLKKHTVLYSEHLSVFECPHDRRLEVLNGIVRDSKRIRC